MQALGNRPNVRVNIESINGYEGSDVSELIFTVVETNPVNGTVIRKVPASDILPILSQPNVTQALVQKYGINNLSQRCAFTEDQVRYDPMYLKNNYKTTT